jgi:hypothetical protein
MVLLLQLSDAFFVFPLCLTAYGFGFAGGFTIGSRLFLRGAAEGFPTNYAIVLFLDLWMQAAAPVAGLHVRL